MPATSEERGPVELLADEIRDVFEAVLMVEDLKPGSSEVSGSVGGSSGVNGKRLKARDGVAITGEDTLDIAASEPAEILIADVPAA